MKRKTNHRKSTNWNPKARNVSNVTIIKVWTESEIYTKGEREGVNKKL